MHPPFPLGSWAVAEGKLPQGSETDYQRAERDDERGYGHENDLVTGQPQNVGGGHQEQEAEDPEPRGHPEPEDAPPELLDV